VSGLAAFDLDTFLEMVQRSRKWQCPTSGFNGTVHDVQVDAFIDRILQQLKVRRPQPSVKSQTVNLPWINLLIDDDPDTCFEPGNDASEDPGDGNTHNPSPNPAPIMSAFSPVSVGLQRLSALSHRCRKMATCQSSLATKARRPSCGVV
jgi:hypothetical protein